MRELARSITRQLLEMSDDDEKSSPKLLKQPKRVSTGGGDFVPRGREQDASGLRRTVTIEPADPYEGSFSEAKVGPVKPDLRNKLLLNRLARYGPAGSSSVSNALGTDSTSDPRLSASADAGRQRPQRGSVFDRIFVRDEKVPCFNFKSETGVPTDRVVNKREKSRDTGEKVPFDEPQPSGEPRQSQEPGRRVVEIEEGEIIDSASDEEPDIKIVKETVHGPQLLRGAESRQKLCSAHDYCSCGAKAELPKFIGRFRTSKKFPHQTTSGMTTSSSASANSGRQGDSTTGLAAAKKRRRRRKISRKRKCYFCGSRGHPAKSCLSKDGGRKKHGQDSEFETKPDVPKQENEAKLKSEPENLINPKPENVPKPEPDKFMKPTPQATCEPGMNGKKPEEPKLSKEEHIAAPTFKTEKPSASEQPECVQPVPLNARITEIPCKEEPQDVPNVDFENTAGQNWRQHAEVPKDVNREPDSRPGPVFSHISSAKSELEPEPPTTSGGNIEEWKFENVFQKFSLPIPMPCWRSEEHEAKVAPDALALVPCLPKEVKSEVVSPFPTGRKVNELNLAGLPKQLKIKQAKVALNRAVLIARSTKRNLSVASVPTSVLEPKPEIKAEGANPGGSPAHFSGFCLPDICSTAKRCSLLSTALRIAEKVIWRVRNENLIDPECMGKVVEDFCERRKSGLSKSERAIGQVVGESDVKNMSVNRYNVDLMVDYDWNPGEDLSTQPTKIREILEEERQLPLPPGKAVFSKRLCYQGGTLLEKLLQDEIVRERNLALQCIRYIVKNNFLLPPEQLTEEERARDAEPEQGEIIDEDDVIEEEAESEEFKVSASRPDDVASADASSGDASPTPPPSGPFSVGAMLQSLVSSENAAHPPESQDSSASSAHSPTTKRRRLEQMINEDSDSDSGHLYWGTKDVDNEKYYRPVSSKLDRPSFSPTLAKGGADKPPEFKEPPPKSPKREGSESPTGEAAREAERLLEEIEAEFGL